MTLAHFKCILDLFEVYGDSGVVAFSRVDCTFILLLLSFFLLFYIRHFPTEKNVHMVGFHQEI